MMRALVLGVTAVAMLSCVGCQRPENTVGYASFGAPLEAVNVMPLSDAVAKADKLGGRPVCVKARIDEVCKKMGCWITLTDGEAEVRVRFTDSEQCKDGFFVPRNAAGHEVYVKGVLKRGEIPQSEARHYAEDSGKQQAEIEKIVGPQPVVTMLATGVMISDGDTLDPPVQ